MVRNRVGWNGAQSPVAIERVLGSVNAGVSRLITATSGVVVRHRQLEGDSRRLIICDGVHLSHIGIDIFLSGLQDGIEGLVFSW